MTPVVSPEKRPVVSKALTVLVNSALGEVRYNTAHRRNDDDGVTLDVGDPEKPVEHGVGRTVRHAIDAAMQASLQTLSENR